MPQIPQASAQDVQDAAEYAAHTKAAEVFQFPTSAPEQIKLAPLALNHDELPTPVRHTLTYKGTLSLDFRIVVPGREVENMRQLFAAEDANEFMKWANTAHPANDDAFVEAVLRMGIRTHMQQALIHLIRSSGMGGSVSPVKLETISMAGLDTDAEVNIQAVEVQRKHADEIPELIPGV